MYRYGLTGVRPASCGRCVSVNGIAPYATGSTLIEWGNTRVICGVTVEESVPRWMKEQNVTGGWITAEYSMLPYSTLQRKQRDISKGKIDGRSQEIQRLIGRAMRAAIDLEKLGRADDLGGLRRAAGGRRDADGGDHGGVRGAVAGGEEIAGGGQADGKPAAARGGGGERGDFESDRRCWTCVIWRTTRRRWT